MSRNQDARVRPWHFPAPIGAFALALTVGCGTAAAQIANPVIEEAGRAAGTAIECLRGSPAEQRAAANGAARVQSLALKQEGAVGEAIAQASIRVGTMYAKANPDLCGGAWEWLDRALRALADRGTHS
jgi:hypothetical protein